MAILAFRNFTNNTAYASGHCKGKIAQCWMSNKPASWPPKLLLLCQSSQERSTALEAKPLLGTKQVTEHNQDANRGAPAAWVHSPSLGRVSPSGRALKCSLRMQTLLTSCSGRFLGSPQDSLQLGGFRITGFGMMVCLPTGYLHWDFPVAINCYHSSPTAAAHMAWKGIGEEEEKNSSWFISLIYGLQ